MKVFFGAPIQGHRKWGSHAEIYDIVIQTIKNNGHSILSEHTTGLTRTDTIEKLEQTIGALPNDEYQSRVYVRNKMIEMLESDDLSGIIFEVSVPEGSRGRDLNAGVALRLIQQGQRNDFHLIIAGEGFKPPVNQASVFDQRRAKTINEAIKILETIEASKDPDAKANLAEIQLKMKTILTKAVARHHNPKWMNPFQYIVFGKRLDPQTLTMEDATPGDRANFKLR